MPSNPSKAVRPVTDYMRRQVAALNSKDLLEFIDKTPFTAEQRKIMLQRLGEIEKDPQSSPKEIRQVEEARKALDTGAPARETPAPAKEEEPVKPAAPVQVADHARTKVEKKTFKVSL